ncbi:MAG: ATP-dependent DNA helicase RecG [Chloroflexi bacterium]|nr:ATP-dependent DNA helicase RecG [Chloroflexota bacterium]
MAEQELLTRLRRVLAHELKSGLRNRAVFGGLQTHCPQWIADLVLEGAAGAEAKRRAAELARYETLTLAERETAIKATLALVDSVAARPMARAEGEPAAEPIKPPQGAAAKVNSAPSVAKVRTSSPPVRRAPALPSPSRTAMLEAPVSRLPGIKGTSASKLRNLGVETVLDLVYLFPRRYSEVKRISDLVPGETQTVVGTVWRATKEARRAGLTLTNLVIADASGTLPVTLFRAGRVDYGPEFPTGAKVMLTGPVELDFGMLRLKPSEVEVRNVPEGAVPGSLLPIYPLSGDLRQNWLRARVADTVGVWTSALIEYLPGWIRQRWQLLDLQTAVRQIHVPDGWPALARARRRLAFDELLLVQLGMLRRRAAYRQGQVAERLIAPPDLLARFLDSLPFQLTGAQKRVVDEIVADLAQATPMMRLLQGEVGSGKTVVAAAALLVAVSAGCQGAIMAPTEILAGQHYRTLSATLDKLGPVKRADGTARPLTVGLLTGSVAPAERRRLAEGVAAGEVDIVVGTHALIEDSAVFERLGLAVVDEQHRFGVEQRAALRQKGHNPHLLAMTATPIPRTLALTLYGDLDLSVIDELPPGRQPVATRSLGPGERSRAYAFIRKRVELGEQAFIICPLIEESDKIEAKAATAEYERLQREVFPDLRLGLLHGKLKAADKEGAMQQFRAGEVQVLVSTSVVEVGVDVPNASVMLVEGADRFGLSRLASMCRTPR